MTNSTKSSEIHPSYYNKPGQLDCGQVQTAMVSDKSGIEAYNLGCAIKYLYRYKEKHGITDLRKAQTYIRFLIEQNKEQGKTHGELLRENGTDDEYESRLRNNKSSLL